MCVYHGVVFPFHAIISNPNAIPLFFRNMNFCDRDALTAFISIFVFPIFYLSDLTPFCPNNFIFYHSALCFTLHFFLNIPEQTYCTSAFISPPLPSPSLSQIEPLPGEPCRTSCALLHVFVRNSCLWCNLTAGGPRGICAPTAEFVTRVCILTTASVV